MGVVGWHDLTNLSDETTNLRIKPRSYPKKTGPDRSGPAWDDHGWYQP